MTVRLTPAQKRVLRSDMICASTDGKTWAYDPNGDSFDVDPRTAVSLDAARWLAFVRQVGGVAQYRPRTPSERDAMEAKR